MGEHNHQINKWVWNTPKYSNNALVFYKSNSQATSGGGWGSRNSHAIARRT